MSSIEVTPRVIFTVNGGGVGNPRSAEIVALMETMNQDAGKNLPNQCYLVFDSPQAVKEFFSSSPTPPAAAVVLEDAKIFTRAHFQAIPNETFGSVSESDWTHGARWKVSIGEKVRISGCANQIRADFGKNFDEKARAGQLPRAPQKAQPSKPEGYGYSAVRRGYHDGHVIW